MAMHAVKREGRFDLQQVFGNIWALYTYVYVLCDMHEMTSDDVNMKYVPRGEPVLF